MTIGERIEERRKALGIPSQSALAKIANMRQSTLNGLIRKPYRWSPYLPAIAKALKTTVEYLVGETEDPEANAPLEVDVPPQDREIIDLLSSFKNTERAVLVDMMRGFSERRSRIPASITLPDQLTLTAMFRGILDHVDSSLSKNEQAELLAEYLPIALPATVGARPDLAYRTPEEDQDTASRHAAVSTR